MTYYAPNNQFDLEKLKNLIEQKKDIKKLRLNRKIEKETLNKDLAEIYAPITKNQEKQTENHKRRAGKINLKLFKIKLMKSKL